MTAKGLRKAAAPVAAAATAAMLVAGCGKQANTPGAAPATVGTQEISPALFDYYVSQKTGVAADKVDPTMKAALLQDLDRLKAAAAAEEGKADAATLEALELQRIELLAHAGATAAGVYAAPSEAELKAEYDRYVAGLPATEFHVAHILVATESAALLLIIKLQGGADFAKTASEQSADDSKTRGGDLGWIAPGKLPVDFTNAVQALKRGQITTHPVHTVYGWHVIKLLESRPAAAPPFEQVKAQLAANLQQARYKQFLDSAIAHPKPGTGG
jgi:peptidyl-prolyl cis-trans isomerase C